MSNRKKKGVFRPIGTARVYKKNLLKILARLRETDPVIQHIQFKNFLIQADDCLLKLKKIQTESDSYELEVEYNYYKELYMKTIS